MKRTEEIAPPGGELEGSVYLIMALLPPPVTLDLLCLVTGESPVKVLHAAEDLVRSGHLLHQKDMGAGHYCLADFGASKQFLASRPHDVVSAMSRRTIQFLNQYFEDPLKRVMHIAHVCEMSEALVEDAEVLVQAGDYCQKLNITSHAETYYRIALEAMEGKTLSPSQQKTFIDATVGICMCSDTSLPHAIQRRFLEEALELETAHAEPVREIRLHLLIAKAYLRTTRSEEIGRHLERAWQMLAEHEVPPEIRLQVVLVNSEWLFWQGEITRAIELYESALGTHEDLAPNVETLKSYTRLGWVYSIAGETARGLGLIRAVRKKAREMGAKDLERYATLILMIVLSDAGRIEEGESFLPEIFNVPEEMLDHYVLWPGNGKRAYFAFCRGDYENAFAYREQAWRNSKALGSPYHRGPDNLEVMLGLEQRGMVHPEWTFDSDVERLIHWPDNYMRGVAFRFRAKKELELKGPTQKARKDLQTSIDTLSRAGARIELAHAQVQLARVHIGDNDVAAAETLLKSAWEVFSKVNADLFPKDLMPHLDRSSKNAMWVDSLLEVGEILSEAKTRDELLGQIIKQAMRIAGAERGAVFVRREGGIAMAAGRNIEAQEISLDLFRPHLDLVESVFEGGSEVFRKEGLKPEERDRHAAGLGWVGCFPVKLKARVLGVIYIDRGPSSLSLSEDEFSLLRIISNQAAVALENREAYEEISERKGELEAEAQFYRESREPGFFGERMLGCSEPFKKMLHLVRRVSESDTTAMITGETGAGKELVAQAIHRNSPRADGPFIAVNVAALSPELIASELFGHEKGAYTGASQMRKGRFELAANGTLFLDDIDACTLDVQAKLLRVLETHQFERVGGVRTLETNFRLVAASNRNLEAMVGQGLFRSDFYFRLNVFPIRVPPLRERLADIPLLAQHFVELFCKKFAKPPMRFGKADLDVLAGYDWPGNVRELRHVIERAVLLSGGERLTLPPLEAAAPGTLPGADKILTLREMEARYIIKILGMCRGKVSGPGGAAELLGVKATTLYSLMKRLGVKREAFRVENAVE